MFEKAEASAVNGTHLQGYVDTTYARLVEVFGEPHFDGDGYKVDAEWVLETPAGVATIYNYKSGKNYNGEDGLPVTSITDWHIGGHNKDVVGHIVGAVEQAQLFDEREELVKTVRDLIENIDNDDDTIEKLAGAAEYWCGTHDKCAGYKYAINLTLDDQWNHHRDDVTVEELKELISRLQ